MDSPQNKQQQQQPINASFNEIGYSGNNNPNQNTDTEQNLVTTMPSQLNTINILDESAIVETLTNQNSTELRRNQRGKN